MTLKELASDLNTLAERLEAAARQAESKQLPSAQLSRWELEKARAVRLGFAECRVTNRIELYEPSEQPSEQPSEHTGVCCVYMCDDLTQLTGYLDRCEKEQKRTAVADTEHVNAEPNEIILTFGEEIIRINPIGFHYRGELVKDAGECHRLLLDFLRRTPLACRSYAGDSRALVVTKSYIENEKIAKETAKPLWTPAMAIAASDAAKTAKPLPPKCRTMIFQ